MIASSTNFHNTKVQWLMQKNWREFWDNLKAFQVLSLRQSRNNTSQKYCKDAEWIGSRQRQSAFVENCSFLFRWLPLQLSCSLLLHGEGSYPSAWQFECYPITLKTIPCVSKLEKFCVHQVDTLLSTQSILPIKQSLFLSRCSPIHKQLAGSVTRRVARMEHIETAPKHLHQARM